LSMLFLLLLLSTAHALSIHHRVFHPQGPQLQYVHRAQVSLDPSVSYSASSQDFHLSSHIQQLRESNLDLSKAYYQLALQRNEDASEAQWDVSSVKLCHLFHATSDTIILHAKEQHIHALDYFVSPVLHNGVCPTPKKKKKAAEIGAYIPLDKFNTTVIIETYRTPPLPDLRAPPALTTEGEPVTPVPEKSFIQKYWIYIVPMLIALLISGGSEEAQSQQRGQS